MVDADSLRFLRGQRVRELGEQHGGLNGENTLRKHRQLDAKGSADDGAKQRDYLAVDDVNHRFINTDRKLEDKGTHYLKRRLNTQWWRFLRDAEDSRLCAWSVG